MIRMILRKGGRLVRALPNVVRGYTLYVNPDKLNLVGGVLKHVQPEVRSFADLGGVWRVNGAYSRHMIRSHGIDRGVIVDTDYPDRVARRLRATRKLEVVRGDFSRDATVGLIGKVDVVLMFDVLLHQANPDWDEVLKKYAGISQCLVIYNQQYILGDTSIRLTSLPFEEYVKFAPGGRTQEYREVYEHRNEIHPKHGKPWGDIHNVFQWAISDHDLRMVMSRLGFEEVYYRNHGRFLDSKQFENHAFIFSKKGPSSRPV
jgi:hypothetical protein